MSSLPDGHPPMRPGGLFVAVRGARRDGHDFAADAFASGARAALVARVPANLQAEVQSGRVRVLDCRAGARAQAGSSRPAGGWDAAGLPPDALLLLVDDPQRALQDCARWWRRRHPARVLAITGSVGKTTTKELLANTLARRYRVLRTSGNLNNELGLPFTLLQLTPDHERAVLEIGISAIGEMDLFAAIAGPDCAVVTRVAPAHLHQLNDLDTVEREKGRLVEAVPGDGVVVLNADDERVARMARRTAARVVLFGEGATADVRACDVEAAGLDGLRFRLRYRGRAAAIRVPLVGRHFLAAALAAAAAAFQEGCSWDEVAAGLAQAPDARRIVPSVLANGVTLLDDTYNASPAATVAALDVLAALPGRRVAVLGDMLELGAYAAAAHRMVGAHVPGRADVLVTVGDLGRIIADAARGRPGGRQGMDRRRVHVCATSREAAAFLRATLTGGEYVLVKGSRGMRMDEIVAGLRAQGEYGRPAGA